MKAKHTIAVRCGETYRVPRARKPAAYVKILRVQRGQQPKVFYRRITKAGKPRPERAAHWLQYFNGAWRLPEAWEPHPI